VKRWSHPPSLSNRCPKLCTETKLLGFSHYQKFGKWYELMWG
jgi:hypothetical protein